jgi:hypothetical protein
LRSTPRGITRRRLLAASGAATAAAAIGIQPSVAFADAGSTPLYLVRSGYNGLSTLDFDVDGTRMRLVALTDLPGLEGSEDAFSLQFSGGPVFPGLHTFAHPNLGRFDLMLGPVEQAGLYEAVINRSVDAPKHYPKAYRHPPEDKDPTRSPGYKATHLKHASVRRAGHGVLCEIVFNERVDLKRATLWLSRGGVVVAAKVVHGVRGHRLSVRLPAKPRHGHYQLTVGTKDRHGHVETKLARVTLQ